MELLFLLTSCAAFFLGVWCAHFLFVAYLRDQALRMIRERVNDLFLELALIDRTNAEEVRKTLNYWLERYRK